MKNKKLFAILTLVCFMFTLMPMAAFAAMDEQASFISVEKEEVNKNDEVAVILDLNDATGSLYLWVEEDGYADVVVKAVDYVAASAEGIASVTEIADGVFALATVAKDAELEIVISREGNFTVHAATENPTVVAVKDIETELRADGNAVAVSTKVDSNDYVLTEVKQDGVAVAGVTRVEDGKSFSVAAADSVGIDATTISFVVNEYYDTNKTPNLGDTVYAKDIEIDTTSGVEVTDLEVSRSGKVSFDVTTYKTGTHKVTVALDNFKATIKVVAGIAEAEEIEVISVSKTPVNKAELGANLENYMLFGVYDANGNAITWDNVAPAPAGIENATLNTTNYVSLTDKPEDSNLESDDFEAVYSAAKDAWTINKVAGTWDEEGTYTFKVALNDGTYAKASITIKEADDAVALNITYDTDSVQLGSSISPKAVVRLDANYVASTVVNGSTIYAPSDIEFAVTGAAVEKVVGAEIFVKDNEKYVGSEIKVTVVDKANNLVATKVLTVVDEANELVFDTTNVPVDGNKKVTVTLVDENGKAVALPTGATSTSAYVVVLEKPADADVTADTVSAVNAAKGTFTFNFSADKVGTYEVQAVLQVKVNDAWRYFTGVGEIKVGAVGMEDTVVMSINANKIVVNDEVKAIPAAPMIKDSRTFVPFRALAEAFGADVEWVEATQSVVAELDGTKVVMNIGEKVYTVNGAAKTADVAPFINGASTMVPVRFVAEAFGITVTPIAAEDGSIADVLFTK